MCERRVLVSGGGGFLGRQICAALGDRAVATPTPRPDLLTDAGRAAFLASGAADTLVHAAWVTGTGAFWTSEANLAWVAATLELARAFHATGGRRVVLVGSCAEYDWSRPGRGTWRETRPCRPGTLYGAAKLSAWITLDAYARQTGMTAACARVFMAVGPHEAPARLLPALIRAGATATPLATGPGDLTREFLDVRDAGAAIAAVALSNLQGPVNVGAGRTHTLRELVGLVPGAAQAARLGERGPRPGEPLVMVPNGARLRRATGFAPRYTLADTVAAAIAAQARDRPRAA